MTIWMPDTRAPGFDAEARRQCQAANKADAEERTLDWIDRVGTLDDDDGAQEWPELLADKSSGATCGRCSLIAVCCWRLSGREGR